MEDDCSSVDTFLGQHWCQLERVRKCQVCGPSATIFVEQLSLLMRDVGKELPPRDDVVHFDKLQM